MKKKKIKIPSLFDASQERARKWKRSQIKFPELQKEKKKRSRRRRGRRSTRPNIRVNFQRVSNVLRNLSDRGFMFHSGVRELLTKGGERSIDGFSRARRRGIIPGYLAKFSPRNILPLVQM